MVPPNDKTPLTDRTPRDELILGLYGAKVPVVEIAARSGVCVKTVRNVARRGGIPPRIVRRPERDAAILVRYRRGDPVGAIARDHRVGRSRVRAIAQRAGLAPWTGWQRRYPINESAFDRPTPVGWWLIGLRAADGSIDAAQNRVSLCQTLADADVLHAFHDYVGCPDRPLTMLKLSAEAQARQWPRRPAAEARIFSRQIVAALARHGVVPHKSKTLTLGPEASGEAAVWLGILDGDGSVGSCRDGRAPTLRFFGTAPLMRQCESFWRHALDLTGPRPTARPHRRGIWTYGVQGGKAVVGARLLLAASPRSLRRKRALLAEIAGSIEPKGLCGTREGTIVSPERRR